VTSTPTEPGFPPPNDPFLDLHEDLEAMRVEAEEEAEDVAAQRSFLRELPVLILIALAVAILIQTLFLQTFFIPSGSMENTLEVDDRVMVNKLSYRWGDIERGDIVVFDDPNGVDARPESWIGRALRTVAQSVGLSTPESEFIKRVIALEGETVEIRRGTVLIDGVPLEEPYLHPDSRLPRFEAVTVPPGHVFVMGDHRNISQDSRVFGPIPVDDIVGRAFVVIWPPSRWSGL
jgi:signal peptidase I